MSKVSRSVYQKVVEENKRLLSDIEILTENTFPSSSLKILVLAKWRKYFDEQKRVNELLRGVAYQYFKNNSKEPAVIGLNEIKKKYEEK